MSKIALYPGSFDPISNGHIDIIKRAATLFDRVIIAVATNTSKKALFTEDEKIQLILENVASLSNVEVVKHSGGLTVDLADELNVDILLRGLRSVKDFEYEADIAAMNKTQNSRVETVFLVSNERYRFVSSSLVKEVAMFGGDISGLVPDNVNVAMKKKYEIE
ncbi:pantetheine-phosphate adenylyltransferase [Desemzia sp. FAM 23991]|uniref:pantetheine-phosphate adenylyltransferase n=1 Tax=unclassified Desemzia TaxID=2685243 RepID=UPI003887FC7C